ncbi:autotransporter domain-containing protein [Brenneria izbisi]|uniref:Autotransporter domain-containing protein n=1 Tax=Brenneria izbisi TaxID=2939450 RepID=A0AA41Y4G1_9GAMM|nr:autotransporter serine protease [Brenneria izbisi]MCV9879211.1 autotransporter domain-containing protein [Brenneria izbisi]MCV9882755.1 autotransporter domain-containing protein [Brenneria izbisi]
MACFPATPLRAATADDFRTPEYLSNGASLDSMRAADAYALGFSGRGVTVGIIDTSADLSGAEFLGRVDDRTRWISTPADRSPHGRAVAGVIGEAKNDAGVQGVAYNANLLALGTDLSIGSLAQAMGEIAEYPDVKIINNSWGFELYYDNIDSYSPEIKDEIDNILIPGFTELAEGITSRGKLMVVSAGNEGHLTPALLAGLPTWLDVTGRENRIGNNWLNVMTYDPRQSSNSAAFIASFSNLALGASEYSLLAPGVEVSTTIGEDTYTRLSGTSFSAPYVAGVGALVSEAFPYLDGKQIADVLLSTATPLSGDNRPKAIMLTRNEYDGDLNLVDITLKFYSTQRDVTVTEDEINVLLGSLITEQTPEEVKERLRDMILTASSEQNITVLPENDYQSLFGQGIVNAYKAVQGPGALNARRLSDDDIGGGATGGEYALYGVDTQGVDSAWRNDIAQVRNQNPESTLFGRDVGLRKQGDGTLYLTGDNRYAGPTIIQGGEIVVGAVAGGTGSLAGDVWVQSAATLSGHGKIAGSVTVDDGATLSPGTSIGTLTVGNVTFRQGGIYAFEVDEQGRTDSLRVTQDAHLAGKVMLTSAYPQAFGERFSLVNVGGKLTGAFDPLTSPRQTLFLTDTLSYSDQQAYLEVARNSRPFNDVAQNRNQSAVAQAIDSQKRGRVFAVIADTRSEEAARAAFDNLNGEIYAASRSAMFQRSRYMRDVINSSMHAGKADALWLSSWANEGQVDKQPGFAQVTHSGYGFLIGNGNAIGENSTLGFALGSEKSKIKIDERASSTDVTAYHLAGFWGSKQWGMDIRSGITYSYLDMASERSITVPGLESRARSKYRAHLAQGFAEGSHRFAFNDHFSLEPYGNAAYVWMSMPGARENGGEAALNWRKQTGGTAFSTLGLRSELRFSSPLPVAFYTDAGYQRRMMADDNQMRLRFARGDEFTIKSGADRDTLLLRAGMSLGLTQSGKLSLGYQGMLGKNTRDDSVRMQFSATF